MAPTPTPTPAPQSWKREAGRDDRDTEADRHERAVERWSTTPHRHEFVSMCSYGDEAPGGPRVCVLCSVSEVLA